VNRPNYGGNTIINNNTNNINNISSIRNSNRMVNGGWGAGWGGGSRGWGYPGGWGGGSRGWGYPGGWGGGARGWGYPGGWGGGWASPYYGSWYRGNWGNANSFWTGFGAGALTSFGLSSLYRTASYGALGYPGYGYGYGSVYSYFPTWSLGTYNTWGLGSFASTTLYSNYVNPYNTIVVAAQPAQPATTVVYDYSQPINVAATPPEPSVAESTEQVFSAARDSFKAGDYSRALDLADQVLKQTPNAPVVHEFRALCLFALKRYDEAASVAYAVLSAGPGWNWSTMIGLYPDVDPYTNQLRALEAAAKTDPSSSSLQFLLAYHYLVQGHEDVAASQFEKVAKLQPNDQLSASFVKALKKAAEPAPTALASTATGPTTGSSPSPPGEAPTANPPVDSDQSWQASEPEQPPPPPADLQGSWKAQPAPDVTISLNIEEGGSFRWEVDDHGKKQTIEGQAGFQDGNLALLQSDGPPLVGKVTQKGVNSFTFAPPGTGDQSKGLTFTR
jgi:tetratricopeptide (TPR) repeat protein